VFHTSVVFTGIRKSALAEATKLTRSKKSRKKDQMCFYMFLKWFERFFRNYKVTKQYTVLAITVVTVKFSNIVAYSTKWLKTDKRIKCRQHCCF